MLKITYWSDYACPYCYIAEARLKKAIASMPRGNELEIEMKAFQLDPSAGKHAAEDTQTRFAKKYRIPFDDAGKRIDAISRLGSPKDSIFDTRRLVSPTRRTPIGSQNWRIGITTRHSTNG